MNAADLIRGMQPEIRDTHIVMSCGMDDGVVHWESYTIHTVRFNKNYPGECIKNPGIAKTSF